MESAWLRTATVTYRPDESGRWRGHWIGRAWNERNQLRGLSFASRRRRRIWAFWLGRDRRQQVVKESELLYLTSDPNETPLVMPPWVRDVPDLAAKIDAGYELHRRGHELAAEHGITVRCPINHA